MLSRLSKFAIVTSLSVLSILSIGKIVLRLPTSLCLFLAATYASISFCVWFFRRRLHSNARAVMLQLTAWLFLSGTMLIALYKIDRAGWNWYRLTGYDMTIDEIVQSSPADIAAQYGWVHEAEGGVRLPAGDYRIDATIVLPEHVMLLIEPGVTLRFAAGVSLICRGGITAVGTPEQPIRFMAQHVLFKWGVVAVDKGQPSRFEHACFENARWASVNGVDFVAGLSIYDTDVEIKNCSFEQMFGKDAVNIRRAHAVVSGSTFRDVYKDGIDMDGGSGEITNNLFINCQDEGIDLSENVDIQVYGNTVRDAFGGRIAAENMPEQVRAGNSLGYLQR